MAKDTVEVIPLGGVGEIGKNMMAVRHKGQMVILDAGLSFPSGDLHGVDIVVPDVSFLVENAVEIQGIVLTHGHEDHVGALPYTLSQITAPVHATKLTLELVKPKLAEKMPGRDIELVEMKPGVPFRCGVFEIEAIPVTHSIPESCTIAVSTSLGAIVLTGDYKFDHTPVDGKLSDMGRFGALGEQGVLLLMSDCTNVERPGWGPSERTAGIELDRIIREAPGRVMVTTFASNIHRMQQVMDCALRENRKVAVAGRRMEQNLEITRDHGYIRYPSDLRIKLSEVDQYPPNGVVILTTGSQGEPFSALSLMAQDEYPKLRIQPGDTVILSATPIPGNESSVWRTVNRLVRQGANVIHSGMAAVHVSGHAFQEELKLMLNLLKPRYIAPVHGEPRHQALYRDMAFEMGWDAHHAFILEIGDRLVFSKDGASKGEKVQAGRVLIDSGGQFGVPEDVVRDRRHLATDGVVMVMVGISSETGAVIADPDFVWKGFVPPDESLWDDAKDEILAKLRGFGAAEASDWDAINDEIAGVLRRYLRKRTGARPVIVPVVVEM